MSSVSVLLIAVFTGPSASVAQEMSPQAGKTHPLAAELLRGYGEMQGTLAQAAEKMPDEHYGFKATPDVKPFGQLVAHVALSQFGMCSRFKGEPNPRKDEKEDARRTRAETIALLKASTSYCEPIVTSLTEATATELAKVGQDQVAKALLPMSLVAHGMEMYGTMAVYLRLKGIVPPTTERQNQMTMKKSQ
jgi:uncharacterized damage-inducible protein DinB